MKSLLRYWPWLLTLAAMAAALVVHGDYGVTWDEGVQARYGELSLDYFASVFRDTSCNDYLDLRFYGPLFEMIPAAVDRVLGRPLSDKFETRHLVSGLLAVLGLPAIVLIGRLFRVPWLPSLAVLALMVSPRFVGHAFNNSKDMPFAVTTLWFLWAASALVLESDAPRRRILICGVTLGLALAARPAGFPLLALYLVGTLWIAGRLLPVEEPGARRPMWGVAAAALVLGWILMVLPWPWAHSSPLGHPLEAMRASTSVATSYPVLFGGEVVTSQELPWTYLVTYLLIATPLVLLLATVVGVVMTVHSLLTEPRHRRSVMGVLVLFWLVLPLVGFVVKRPNVYDGLRHFLFL